MSFRPSALIAIVVPLSLLLWSCGGDNSPPPPPTAYDQTDTTSGNVSLSSTLEQANVDFNTSDFVITTSAANGAITLDPVSGDFTYFPNAGFVGVDDFFWQVSDQFGYSNVAEFTIGVGVPAMIQVEAVPLAAR